MCLYNQHFLTRQPSDANVGKRSTANDLVILKNVSFSSQSTTPLALTVTQFLGMLKETKQWQPNVASIIIPILLYLLVMINEGFFFKSTSRQRVKSYDILPSVICQNGTLLSDFQGRYGRSSQRKAARRSHVPIIFETLCITYGHDK